MEVFLDTNVLADIFLRPTLAPASHRVIEWCKIPGRRAWISWPTVATLAYLFEEAGRTPSEITTRMRLLRSWTEIASAGTTLFDRALALNMPDFEDAIQAAHAESCGAHLIVTRNTADFTNSPVPAMTPEDFLTRYAVSAMP